jgi:hypothetical protein
MPDIGTWMALQTKAKALCDAAKLSSEMLTTDELSFVARSFERQFVVGYAEREIVDIYRRHMVEILAGAMVAKKQMDAQVQGEQPGSNKVGGPLVIRAGWLGIGDDWEDGGASIATGTEQNWIHSGTSLLGGTAGNPIKIGENAVHVIIGIGSYHPSPKIEAVKFKINGNEFPIIVTKFPQLSPGSLRIKELDNAYIWAKDTEVLGTVFVSAIHGSTVTDIPYLLGASYIKEPQLKKIDPYYLCGTASYRDTEKVVKIT